MFIKLIRAGLAVAILGSLWTLLAVVRFVCYGKDVS